MKTLAEIAYDAAYITAVFQGANPAKFNEITPELKAQWKSAAAAVRDEVIETLQQLWS